MTNTINQHQTHLGYSDNFKIDFVLYSWTLFPFLSCSFLSFCFLSFPFLSFPLLSIPFLSSLAVRHQHLFARIKCMISISTLHCLEKHLQNIAALT